MTSSKKTKIVCTIGPSSESLEKLSAMAEAGMDVVRLNFSHGSFEEHQSKADRAREVVKKTGRPIAILQDLCGPKIRIGEIKNGPITLKEGETFVLTTDPCDGASGRVNVNYSKLPKEVREGSAIMLRDGTRELKVTEVRGNDIITKVVVGGELASFRGVNVPGAGLSISSLTDKDRKDVEFGIRNRVDFVALSFVRKAADILELRDLLQKAGSNAGIIAKIETPEALADIDDIIRASDGIMVARGDLAIEIPAEKVPLTQKTLIRKCNAAGKPVITATQMLESMIRNPLPTRAEVSDVANAIIDGTDAVMLSEETALGDHPVTAVKMMAKIAASVEKDVYTHERTVEYEHLHGVNDVVSRSAVRTAHTLGAKLLVVLTRSGRTGRMISRYRPAERILALSDVPEGINKLALSFGCYPLVVPTFKTVDKIMDIVRRSALGNKLAKAGDKVVIVAGMPFGTAKETNFMVVETL